MFDLIAILIPIVLAVCIVVTIKIIEDARLRRRFLEANADPQLVRAIMSTETDARRGGSLKWGVITIAVGVAFATMWWWGLDAENPLSYALLFVATGAGMLLYRVLDPPGR